MPYLNTDMERPSETLNRVLDGRLAMTNAPASIQSQARLAFYDAACEVLKVTDIEKRRSMLKRIPALVRPYVEAEVKRLWTLRKAT